MAPPAVPGEPDMSALSIPSESAIATPTPDAWSDPAPAALELALSGLSGADGVMLPAPAAVPTPQTGRAIHVGRH